MDADERVDVAEELAGLWQELTDEQHEEMLRRNVPKETLLFISKNADIFAGGGAADQETKMRLANCMLAGYILRILEERI